MVKPPSHFSFPLFQCTGYVLIFSQKSCGFCHWAVFSRFNKKCHEIPGKKMYFVPYMYFDHLWKYFSDIFHMGLHTQLGRGTWIILGLFVPRVGNAFHRICADKPYHNIYWIVVYLQDNIILPLTNWLAWISTVSFSWSLNESSRE